MKNLKSNFPHADRMVTVGNHHSISTMSPEQSRGKVKFSSNLNSRVQHKPATTAKVGAGLEPLKLSTSDANIKAQRQLNKWMEQERSHHNLPHFRADINPAVISYD